MDKNVHFTDVKVCRNYLCGTCPHDLFSNTKMDLGPCPRSHLPRYKEMYDSAIASGEQFPEIRSEYERSTQAFVVDIDRKINANRRRLEQTPEEMERSNAIMRDINEMEEAISAAMSEMESLGEQGRVEESLKELAKVDALKAERGDKEKELQVLQENSGASGHQKLRVCDVCGAYLSILDSDRRLADHFSGKMHLGYQRLRELVKEFEKQRAGSAPVTQRAQTANGRRRSLSPS
ncbi:Luc7p [Malassezia vespertilionis]|uniref:Luc7p n=2 Tax=Malassezia vespertilionis TaxID=2020962 RepID=A0A2N1JC93_9BASI|nr:Luc7p [Malassezia vespertilionis]